MTRRVTRVPPAQRRQQFVRPSYPPLPTPTQQPHKPSDFVQGKKQRKDRGGPEGLLPTAWATLSNFFARPSFAFFRPFFFCLFDGRSSTLIDSPSTGCGWKGSIPCEYEGGPPSLAAHSSRPTRRGVLAVSELDQLSDDESSLPGCLSSLGFPLVPGPACRLARSQGQNRRAGWRHS